MDSLDSSVRDGGDVNVQKSLNCNNADTNGRPVMLETTSDSTTAINVEANVVEGNQCENIAVPIVDAVTSRLQQHIQRLWVTSDSSFGRNQDQCTDDDEEMENKNSTMLHELTERPISIVPSTDRPEVAGGFDVCKEYGYKYEYTTDYHDEEDHDGEDEDDMTNTAPELGGKDTAKPQQPAMTPSVPFINLLGKIYHPIHDYNARRDDESSLFWFTYRCDFPEIRPYRITTDAGWGCMLRSAQMLLAHTFRVHYKSRQWMPPSSITRRRQDTFLRSILNWFADFPSKTDCPYSLHNMVAAGLTKYETLPGEWYGPGTASYVLRDLVSLHEKQGQPSLFRVHVASEATVYRDSVHKLMTQESKIRALQRRSDERGDDNTDDNVVPKESLAPTHPLDPTVLDSQKMDESEFIRTLEWDTGLLLLIPLRLGLNTFNGEYVKAIAHSFSLPQSVGILGGRPRGARWFYGAYVDGSKMLGLDPHTVQTAPSLRRQTQNGGANNSPGKPSLHVELSEEYLRSVHTTFQEAVPISRMDPSIALGFYCRSKKEFEELENSFKEFQKINGDCPDLFAFADKAPDYSLSTTMNDMLFDGEDAGELGPTHPEIAGDSSDEDDFVML